MVVAGVELWLSGSACTGTHKPKVQHGVIPILIRSHHILIIV